MDITYLGEIAIKYCSVVRPVSFCAFIISLCLAGAAAAAPEDKLAAEFASPPDSARPWVYWFGLDGNLTTAGITADLEAMKRVGIGGVIYMEATQRTPKGKVAFAGAEWRELFKHAFSEAARLGLEVNMNNDAGWSGSGGPWITPELSMQKVVYSETRVHGPAKFDDVLTQPLTLEGYYRDICVQAVPSEGSAARLPHFAEKSALNTVPFSLPAPGESADGATSGIVRERVVDLTARMDSKGRIVWDVPPGEWTVIRFGHTSTGITNHPAPKEGEGLECDKLSKEAAETQFNGLMGKLIEDAGPLTGKSLVATHIDSWEIRSQNWTRNMNEEFKARRGYDMMPWFPVLTGRIVESAEMSERFLWDMRQTISELLLENYAGHFQELAHKNGIRLSIESYSNCPTDELAYGGRADEPMAEFWCFGNTRNYFSWACTQMASVGHVYGKKIIGAEAFTAHDNEKWLAHPGNIKDLGDYEFCEGINRFVFHRYALQPWDDVKPGMAMGSWGVHYERTQTWWEQSGAWHTYLARCQYLLQQGLHVADVCYLMPEGSPQTYHFQKLERLGHNFDIAPAEVALTRMAVKDGRIVLPDGMSYRVLVLPRYETMTPELLRKISEMVTAGATVVGNPPKRAPGLTDYPRCDEEVKELVAGLWGTGEMPEKLTAVKRGAGQIVWGHEFDETGSAPVNDIATLKDANWIWHKDAKNTSKVAPGTRFLKKQFHVEEGAQVTSAVLTMSADNIYECWINGKKVSIGMAWERAQIVDVREAIRAGDNLIAVAATNSGSALSAAGLLGSLDIKYEQGPAVHIVTDKSWLSAETVSAGDWVKAGDDSKGWSPAVELAGAGKKPWVTSTKGIEMPRLFDNSRLISSYMSKAVVPVDFAVADDPKNETYRYTHRTLGDAEVYFVANKEETPQGWPCRFRVGDKVPELWWPATGKQENVAMFEQADGFTTVPLKLAPFESVFVVFRKAAESKAQVTELRAGDQDATVDQDAGVKYDEQGRLVVRAGRPGNFALKTAAGATWSADIAEVPKPITVAGPWDVRFEPGRGAPEQLRMDKLISWSDSDVEGVKYFSGHGTYSTDFELPKDYVAGDKELTLDLGEVHVMAEVKVNGKDLGTLWIKPFTVDISDAARAGTNHLEVRVVNLWPNRMIGDEQLPEDSERNKNGTLKAWPDWLEQGKKSPTGRYTFSTWKLWGKDDPLQPSGLIGPVVIKPVVKKLAVREVR